MIHKKTVFILGAGASIPYGFPSGPALRDRLVAHAELERKSELATHLHQHVGIDPEEVFKFLWAFHRSSIISIDTFLAKRREFSELGKFAIAYEMYIHEHEYNILKRGIDDHWYELLWNKLIADVDRPQDIKDNAVRFITFNYDRSLEFFLHESTKNSFGLTDAVAMDYWTKLPILHVYGKVGRFDYRSAADARQYSNTLNAAELRIAANGIKVIPETRDDDNDFQLARAWMADAEWIGFLGFGFDALNVRRLGLKDILEAATKAGLGLPAISTTTLGMTQAEINAAVNMVCPQGWQASQLKSRMALRTWGVLN